jgi:hypothetical protein
MSNFALTHHPHYSNWKKWLGFTKILWDVYISILLRQTKLQTLISSIPIFLLQEPLTKWKVVSKNNSEIDTSSDNKSWCKIIVFDPACLECISRLNSYLNESKSWSAPSTIFTLQNDATYVIPWDLNTKHFLIDIKMFTILWFVLLLSFSLVQETDLSK